jgi:hypothetical protein
VVPGVAVGVPRASQLEWAAVCRVLETWNYVIKTTRAKRERILSITKLRYIYIALHALGLPRFAAMCIPETLVPVAALFED